MAHRKPNHVSAVVPRGWDEDLLWDVGVSICEESDIPLTFTIQELVAFVQDVCHANAAHGVELTPNQILAEQAASQHARRWAVQYLVNRNR